MIRILGGPEQQIFKLDTDTSYYNRFLNPSGLEYMQSAKNRTGSVVEMTPTEYFVECAKMFSTSVYSLMNQRSDDYTDQYKEAMKSGDKFPLTFIDYADASQEGLHRVKAAGDVFGWETKFPVLIVQVFDEERERIHELLESARSFERYHLDKCIDLAHDDLINWSEPVPNDFVYQFKKLIEEYAEELQQVSIEVEVDIKDYNDHGDMIHIIEVALTDYCGLALDEASSNSDHCLEDMFDMEQSPEGSYDVSTHQ